HGTAPFMTSGLTVISGFPLTPFIQDRLDRSPGCPIVGDRSRIDRVIAHFQEFKVGYQQFALSAEQSVQDAIEHQVVIVDAVGPLHLRREGEGLAGCDGEYYPRVDGPRPNGTVVLVAHSDHPGEGNGVAGELPPDPLLDNAR